MKRQIGRWANPSFEVLTEALRSILVYSLTGIKVKEQIYVINAS